MLFQLPFVAKSGTIKLLEYKFKFYLSTERSGFEMKLIVKILITLFGAILIFTDLKENNMLLITFWIVLALYMILEGFSSKNKNIN